MAGAPRGNKNSSSANRLWSDTIRRALVQQDALKLRKIADKLVALAEDGDMSAIREIGDRMDGKAIQQTDVTMNGGLEISTIERKIVKADDKDA